METLAVGDFSNGAPFFLGYQGKFLKRIIPWNDLFYAWEIIFKFWIQTRQNIPDNSLPSLHDRFIINFSFKIVKGAPSLVCHLLEVDLAHRLPPEELEHGRLEDAVVLEPPGGVHLVLVFRDGEKTNVTIVILVIIIMNMLVLEVEK